MIPVEKAIQVILDASAALEPVKVPIMNVRGRILAEDIVTQEDIPAFDYASAPGYAVRSLDLATASAQNPVQIHLDACLQAGQRTHQPLECRHAVKVNMGTPLPPEADAVLPEEYVVRQSDKKILFYRAARAGFNILLKGEDIPRGTLVFLKGRRLSAADIGTLSALGVDSVKCFRVPKVAFFSASGPVAENETTVGNAATPNHCTLYCQLSEYGAKPVDLGSVNHDADLIQQKIEEGLKHDMLIFIAGTAPDDFGLVKKVLEKVGMDVKFWKVAIKPATPIIFGLCNGLPIFGLSGHPFSFYIMVEEFVRPAIMKMMGSQALRRTEVLATLTKDLRAPSGVTTFIGGTVTLTDMGFSVVPDFKKSTSIRAYCTVNGLIVVPGTTDFIRAGSKVTVQILADLKSN